MSLAGVISVGVVAMVWVICLVLSLRAERRRCPAQRVTHTFNGPVTIIRRGRQ